MPGQVAIQSDVRETDSRPNVKPIAHWNGNAKAGRKQVHRLINVINRPESFATGITGTLIRETCSDADPKSKKSIHAEPRHTLQRGWDWNCTVHVHWLIAAAIS